MSELIHATIDGRTYDVPGIWVAGFCTVNPGASTADALRWWDYQAQLAEAEEREV